MLTGKVCSTKTRLYALVVEGSVDIQGMVAVAKDNDMSAVYIAWMCINSENNKLIADSG